MSTKKITTTEYFSWSEADLDWVPTHKSVSEEVVEESSGLRMDPVTYPISPYQDPAPYVAPYRAPWYPNSPIVSFSDGEPHTDHNYD